MQFLSKRTIGFSLRIKLHAYRLMAYLPATIICSHLVQLVPDELLSAVGVERGHEQRRRRGHRRQDRLVAADPKKWPFPVFYAEKRNRFRFSPSQGVDIMITNYCDFCQFFTKKLAFFSITKVMNFFSKN
jgi:hypothetical protein